MGDRKGGGRGSARAPKARRGGRRGPHCRQSLQGREGNSCEKLGRETDAESARTEKGLTQPTC